MSENIKLPDVGQIRGFQLLRQPTAKASEVELQYTDHKGQWYELKMPLLDALYLLNLLKKMSRENGYDSLLSDSSLN